ncbi:hypothetical protein OROHE_014614 [Orobanche hederae]
MMMTRNRRTESVPRIFVKSLRNSVPICFNFFDVTSTSNLKVIAVDDDDEEHEFQHFDDFTLASSWERLCRQWLADGLKNPLERCGWFFFISYYI